MSKKDYLFTSESVTEGHPDKVADQISDAILDAIIDYDPRGRVACETLVTTGLVFISGEITTTCYVDMPQIVRDTIRDIGYNSSTMGFDWETCSVITSIDQQSADIAQGVNGKGLFKEQGAGDQGLMFGYACNETPELMPMPICYAHKLTMRLAEVRKNGSLDFLRPDGKSQITIQYENSKPKRVEAIVIAAQHSPDISYSELKEAIVEEVIKKVVPKKMIDGDTKYFINTTGRFVLGGPPSKVDRSASYMARHVAKNIVAAGLATKCEVQLAYSIGVARPISVLVDTYKTEVIPRKRICEIVNEVFDLRPAPIIEYLKLLRPIYKKTACYGHFGRNDPDFTWEKTNMVDVLTKKAGIKKPRKKAARAKKPKSRL